MAVELTLAGSDQSTLAWLRGKADVLIEGLSLKLNGLMLELQSKIVGEKLHGQVLHQRTGKLAGSIRAIEVVQEGTELVGDVVGAGGPAWYGRLHEYGGTFDVPHGRRYVSKKTLKEMQTKPYTITFPERSFMRSTLEEMQGEMIGELQSTIDGMVNE